MDVASVNISADNINYLLDALKSKDRLVMATSVEVGESGVDGKVFCADCACYVQPVGHSSRCRVPTYLTNDVKDFSWIGDAIWETAVRSWVVSNSLERSVAQKLVANSTLADYLDEGGLTVDFGQRLTKASSEQSKANVVEASVAVSSECRLALCNRLGMYTFACGELNRSILSEDFDERLSSYPDPLVDGYCYLNCFSRLRWAEIANLLGRYPEAKLVLQFLERPDVVKIWYFRRYFGYLHIFSTPVELAETITCSLAELLKYPAERVGGTKGPGGADFASLDDSYSDSDADSEVDFGDVTSRKAVDVTKMILALRVDSSWSREVVTSVVALKNALWTFHSAQRVPFHAMTGFSVAGKLLSVAGKVPADEKGKQAVVRVYKAALTAAEVSLVLLPKATSGYIASTGVMVFQEVNCSECFLFCE